jgi:hypothetical protein
MKKTKSEDLSWFRFHKQKLAKTWRHGRYWLDLGSKCLHQEWVAFSGKFSIGVEIDHNDDEEIKITLSFPWLSLYTHLGGFVKRDWKKESREFNLGIHHNALWWNFGMPTHFGDSNDSKWRRGSFDFVDFALGKIKFSTQYGKSQVVPVSFPEGNYDVIFTEETYTWKRPRWFEKTNKNHYDIYMLDPIPTGWDNYGPGVDGVYSTGCTAKNLAEAVGKLTTAIYKDRQHDTGNMNWKPAEKLNRQPWPDYLMDA